MSSLFYEVRNKQLGRALSATLGESYETKVLKRLGVVLSASEVLVNNQRYALSNPGTVTIGSTIEVQNVGRPAAALYAPVPGGLGTAVANSGNSSSKSSTISDTMSKVVGYDTLANVTTLPENIAPDIYDVLLLDNGIVQRMTLQTLDKTLSQRSYRYNVFDFGAVGDETTDDSLAIQAAIDAAAAVHGPNVVGTVYFPAGFYICNAATLIIPSPLNLVGDSEKASILYRSDPGVLLQIAPTSGSYTGVPVTIANMRFVNEGTGTASSCIEVVNPNEYCIDTKISHCWFQGVPTYSTAVGIKALSHQIVISDCIFDMLLTGIHLMASSQNVTISNPLMSWINDVGIVCAGSAGLACRNINISNLLYAASHVSGPFPAAIKADYVNGLNITGVHAYNVDSVSPTFLLAGIYVAACNRVNIANVNIVNAVGTNTDYSAALHCNGCTDVSVTNFHTQNDTGFLPAYGMMVINSLRFHIANFSLSGALRYGFYGKTLLTGSMRDGYIAYTGVTDPATYAALHAIDGTFHVSNVLLHRPSSSYSTYAFDVVELDDGDIFTADDCSYDGGILPVDTTTIAANPTGLIRIGSLEPIQYFTANDTTPSVISGRRFKTANSSSTTISAFDGGQAGQKITVLIGDANTTVDFTGTVLLGNDGADWVAANGDWLEALCDGTYWYCMIGKNTSTPSGKIIIAADGSADQLRIQGGTNANEHIVVGFDTTNNLGIIDALEDTVGYRNIVIAPTTYNNLGVGDSAPAEKLDVTGNINATGVIKIDDVQVVSNRVIDARCDDTIDSGDATTDGVIDALRDAMIAHGLIAAA